MELVAADDPVLGLRVWEAREDGRLCSVFWPSKWAPGVNHASCGPDASLRADAHVVPDGACCCGLYGYSDLNHRDLAFYERSDVVVGTIAAWGRIEPEIDGFRAESARLLAIGAATGSVVERRAAIRYSVPLVPMAELAGFSRRHARPVGLARQMRGAVILVVDCGPAAAACLEELRVGLHRFVGCAGGRRIDMVVCGQGAFVAPLIGDAETWGRLLAIAIDQLVPDCEGPALARGIERARGRVLWSHRRWSIDVVVVAMQPPDAEAAEQLQRARRDGVRVICLTPAPGGGWDRRLGEHLPIQSDVPGSLGEALRDVVVKLDTRSDQWPADWTRRQAAYPASLGLRSIVGG